jgi:hypothetical protein
MRAIEPGVFGLAPATSAILEWQPPPVPGPPLPVLLDLPVDPDDPTPLTLLALRAAPWAGPYTLWRSSDGTSFEAVQTTSRPAILGETTSELPPGPLWRWDRRASLTIRLAGGALTSGGDLDALAARTVLAIQGTDGAWELVTFAEATLVAAGEWRVSRLIRGLAGSEPASIRPVIAGQRVVVLDSALVPVFSAANDIGAHGHFRISPAGQDYASPGSFAFEPRRRNRQALVPLAPVHAPGAADGSGH